MTTNSIITPSTLVFPKTGNKMGLRSVDLRACLQLSKLGKQDEEARAVLAASVESYLRSLLTHCAFKIHIPAFADSEWHSPRSIKGLLSPTIGRHIVFVDRRGSVWKAICQYLSPLSELDGESGTTTEVAWDLYMLVLATRHKGEVVMDPDRIIANASRLMTTTSLSSEGRARLARLIGLFRLFDTRCGVPSLRVRPSAGPREVTCRIDEILEDAYLLEASQLRRAFGLRQNEARTKRNLRRLLDFIAKNRSWARGLVSLSSTKLIGGDSGSKVMDILLDMLPILDESMSEPVLALTDTSLDYRREGCVRLVRGVSRGWAFRFEQMPRRRNRTPR